MPQRKKKDEDYTYQDEDFNDEDHVMMNKKEKKANKQRRKVHFFRFYYAVHGLPLHCFFIGD